MKKEIFDKMFSKYYNEAKLYVLSLCKNPSLADDVVAEAFFRAFQTIDEEKDGFKYWLLRVCRNLYIDHLRKQKRSAPLEENLVSAGGDDPACALIKQEEYRALYCALDLLKPNYKEVVLLYYFEGLSVIEISKITEQSIENIKVLLFRARCKLKDILEESL